MPDTVISKTHATWLICGGVALIALFAVLDYTVGEPPYSPFLLLLAVWGIASTSLGLYRFINHIFGALTATVLLVLLGYGLGSLINRVVVDSFAWPAK
jgi:hypothetical protein